MRSESLDWLARNPPLFVAIISHLARVHWIVRMDSISSEACLDAIGDLIVVFCKGIHWYREFTLCLKQSI